MARGVQVQRAATAALDPAGTLAQAAQAAQAATAAGRLVWCCW
jgi:hypothetical protein